MGRDPTPRTENPDGTATDDQHQLDEHSGSIKCDVTDTLGAILNPYLCNYCPYCGAEL